ncbi:MAG: hypothetical protein WC461_02020 [Candidatus Paceibacterota bacterium]
MEKGKGQTCGMAFSCGCRIPNGAGCNCTVCVPQNGNAGLLCAQFKCAYVANQICQKKTILDIIYYQIVNSGGYCADGNPWYEALKVAAGSADKLKAIEKVAWRKKAAGAFSSARRSACTLPFARAEQP